MKTAILLLALLVASSVTAQLPPPSTSVPGQAPSAFDKNLRINAPLLNSRVKGKVWIKGKANPRSKVKLVISSVYYKYRADHQQEKIFKGDGPFNGQEKTLIVTADAAGNWATNAFYFRNQGWTETFKIVARSVLGKNATYVTVYDDTKPTIAWD